MELPVIIMPLPNQTGFSARLVAIDLSAEAPTADEAHARLTDLLKDRIAQGAQIRSLNVPLPVASGGWLPNDELTQEWLQHMRDYRAECDAKDLEELEQLTKSGEISP